MPALQARSKGSVRLKFQCFRSRLTAAAKSNWPPTAAGFAEAPPGFGAAGGREAVGTVGLPGAFGAPGLLARGGGPGLGFTAGGGAFVARELVGLELAGVLPLEAPFVVAAVFFHGVAEPLEGAMPGNTATGFADGSAVNAFAGAFATGAADAAGAGGIRRPAGGGGGGGGGGEAFC